MQEQQLNQAKYFDSLRKNAVKSPYLPPRLNNYKYTVVLDLDETLGHTHEKSNTFHKRPYLDEFLAFLKDFEVVIWTAGEQNVFVD